MRQSASGQVAVAVAVKVHVQVQVHDQVNAEGGTPSALDELCTSAVARSHEPASARPAEHAK